MIEAAIQGEIDIDFLGNFCDEDAGILESPVDGMEQKNAGCG